MELCFKYEPKLTKDYLLSKYSEETYMEYYLGIPVKKGLFVSPLRQDSTPTCSFYRNKKGELIFKDFRGDFYGNFINVVMTKFKVSYHQALRIIAKDFGLISGTSPANPTAINVSAPKFVDEGPADIRVQIRDFTPAELEWWGQYGITSNILKKYNVFSCQGVFLRGNLQTWNTNDLVFGYYGGKKEDLELWRIYYPNRESYRFLTNWPAKKIQGLKQLKKTGDVVVITKSMKDCMALAAYGIPAIAPNSENLFIANSVLEDLKSRFKHIVVFYDNDLAGISNMCKIKSAHPELLYFYIPRYLNAKDFSDLRKMYGYEQTKTFINKYGEKIGLKHLV